MSRTYKNAATARNSRVTSQSKPIPGREKEMAQNNAGGFTFTLSPMDRLNRFLILGSEGGTYYVNERTLTEENAKSIISILQSKNGVEAVNRIVEISQSGRAPKNDPALFALALAMTYGDLETKAAAYKALPQVARIGTHLLHLASYVDAMRGWGRGLRRAFGEWYTLQNPKGLATNLVKYANRDGWTHRDVLRLSHPKATGAHQELLAYATEKPYNFAKTEVEGFMNAVLEIKSTQDVASAVRLISDHKLPREVIPTELLTEKSVWEALLPHMGMTALVRNLATMTRVGLITQQSAGTKLVLEKLRNDEELKRSRFHPIAALAALLTYRAGQSARGSNTWTPVTKITDELDELFYRSFGVVVPTGKRLVLAIDVSGSMTSGAIAGVLGLSPRVASAALAMLAARTESDAIFVGFTGRGTSYVGGYRKSRSGFSSPTKTPELSYLDITKKDRLDTVVDNMNGLPFGGTDCALPMVWAKKEKIAADAFIVLTDNETWAGSIQPSQALKQYRDSMGIPAKLVVVGMTATNFTIADPKDVGSMDVVGFDTTAPQIISQFIKGEI